MPTDLDELLSGIRAAMDYAVPEDKRPEAEELLDIYREDRLALLLLHEFYSFLPEAEDDWVRDILLIKRRRGIFLLALVASARRYLYLVSEEGIEFHGDAAQGFADSELLDFFDFASLEEFMQQAQATDAPSYAPLQLDAEICPVCHAASGEYHELGCVVELCPWCGGQLVYCSCRHDQLGADSIDTEAQLVQFEAILEERGRIPYSPEQRPAYLQEGLEEEFD